MGQMFDELLQADAHETAPGFPKGRLTKPPNSDYTSGSGALESPPVMENQLYPIS
jgi:hypothetical protein